jgi:hypothetical protein
VTDVLDLPFDQYQRYRLVMDLLGEVRGDTRSLRILDVGGRTALLRSFLPDDEVVLVDVEASGEPGLVLGDGSALPFADGAFDAVLAFDTLEHVPPAGRAAFTAELARVAKRWVMIAGPYAAPEVDEAERLLERFLREKLAVEHRYLAEHRSNGLPVRADVEAALRDAGAEVTSIGHGNVRRWLALMCLAMAMDYEPELRDLARQFYRYYNAELYDDDVEGPVYRHVVVAAFAGASLPQAQRPARKARGASGAALGTGPLVELAFDLIGFDRARDAARDENRRLWSVNDSLRGDLDGHKRTLADLGERDREQRAVIDRLRDELVRHAEETLAIERAAARREVEESKARAELEHELAGHRRELETLRARLAAEEGAHEATRKVVADLRERYERLSERDAGQADTIAALRAELERHAAETLATERAVHARQAEEAGVRAELERELALARAEQAKLADLVEREGAARAAGANAADEARARAEALAREIDERKGIERALAEDLAGHRAVVGELQAELARQAAELELRGGLLAERDAVLVERAQRIAELEQRSDALRAELRDRAKNLKRVFGPKFDG